MFGAVSSLVPGAGQALSARLMLAKLQDPDSQERARFSELLHRRFVDAGGASVRIVASRTDDVLKRSAPPTPERIRDDTADSSWTFTYKIDREDGYRVAFAITGQSYRGLGGQRLEDVFRLLDAVCRRWELDDLHELARVLNDGVPSTRKRIKRFTIVTTDEAASPRAA